MQSDFLASLRALSDAELVARVRDFAARERDATLLLVAHLAELDTRDVHYRAGHASLFGYCRDALGLSEQEAYNRIAVARAARRFPVILELLETCALNLTSVRLLAPHLTVANHGSVLESARGKTRAQVEELAAALWPRPDAPSFVRKLPAARPVPPAQASPLPGSTASAAPPWDSTQANAPSHQTAPSSPHGFLEAPAYPGSTADTAPADPSADQVSRGWTGFQAGPVHSSSPDAGPQPPAASGSDAAAHPSCGLPPPGARRSVDVTALSPDRYRVQVTIGGDTLEKLRLAKDLLRHALPSGDEAAILDRALTALLADLTQKKFAATEKPRPAGGATPGSRHVPAEVKRTVWLRDLGRCAFVGTTGRRCVERAFLEFHHVMPYALGGEATVANIQLRCRSHNAYEARQYFGNGNGNGGAGFAREETKRYGPGSCETSLGTPTSATRSGTSCRSGPVQGPAP
jgi:hypothetical protein